MNLAACLLLPTIPLVGVWHRAYQRKHRLTALNLMPPAATSPSALKPTRFNPGNLIGSGIATPYLAEDQTVALYETRGLFGDPADLTAAVPHPQRRPELEIVTVSVNLAHIVDLTDVANQHLLETTAQELTGDWQGYQLRDTSTSISAPTGLAPTQELSAALHAQTACEGFLAISARIPYRRNLVLFHHRLRSNSLRWTDPATGLERMYP